MSPTLSHINPKSVRLHTIRFNDIPTRSGGSGHGQMGGQFFRVLPPAHHGINGTEKVQLLPPGVAGPMEARPACTSLLQGSGCRSGTRTHGMRINSPPLYRLSYPAIKKSSCAVTPNDIGHLGPSRPCDPFCQSPSSFPSALPSGFSVQVTPPTIRQRICFLASSARSMG